MHLWAMDPWIVTKENTGDNVGRGDGQMGKSGRREMCIDFDHYLFFFFQRIMYVHRVLGAALLGDC